MRVLIVGSNARTGSERYSQRYLTFARAIRAAHLRAGDDVQIREWEPELLREGWGRVYVGLSAPAWIGSDRIYGALITIAEMRDGPFHDPRLRFFIDDPDLRVLRNSIASVAADSKKILAPFNIKRRDFEVVSNSPELIAKVERGLRLLVDVNLPWPTTFVPVFPWGSTERLIRQLRPHQRVNVVGLDPSALVLDREALADSAAVQAVYLRPASPYWISEGEKDDPWVRSTLVRHPVMHSRVGSETARVAAYREALGVLEPQLSADGPGWWSTRMLSASVAGTFYAAPWIGLSGMTSPVPYTATLPGAFEDLNETEQRVRCEEQQHALSASIAPVETALEALDVHV